jgi:uncharacterized protein YbjT (DUF2867 family)
MHIILGGTGHVGSATARALLRRGEAVTIVSRHAGKAEYGREGQPQVAVADVHDTDALRAVFRRGKRLFLLNPPADPATDTDEVERMRLSSILAALDGSGLEKIVAQSTYGAQPGRQIGDLGVLYEMEQALAAKPIASSIIRAAYYMSNWDTALETARTDGVVHTFFPVDFQLPMVAPEDLGEAAARLMTEPVERTGVHHVEGPRRYSSADVAAAFADALQRPVTAVEVRRERWIETYRSLGFSDAAAASYAGMTAATVGAHFPPLAEVERGTVSLQAYIGALTLAPSRPEEHEDIGRRRNDGQA